MLATTRRAYQLAITAAMGLVGLLGTPTTGAAVTPPGMFYLSFEDRLPTLGGTATDNVAYAYVGRLSSSLRPRLRVVRNGSVIVETASGPSHFDDSASVPALAAGDQLRVEDQITGEVYAQAVFDGRPTFLEGACGAVTELTGVRTAGAEISGAGAYDPSGGNDYGGPDNTRIDASFVGDGPGTDFETEFERPVPPGFRVWAEEQFDLSNTTNVRTFREQPVRPCAGSAPSTPSPGPGQGSSGTPPRAADVRPPSGTVTKPKDLARRTIAQLGRGTTFTVLSDEPGTVDATVVLRTTHKGKTKRTTLGSRTQPVAASKKQRVRLTVSAADRRRLRAARASSSARVIFSFTVRDAAHNATVLPRFTIRVPRR